VHLRRSGSRDGGSRQRESPNRGAGGFVADVASATDATVIANNGVRDEQTVTEYLDYGADAVSVGRPSDDPRVLSRVREATDRWFDGGQSTPERREANP
jgi:tRNA-dihydrouridine synthase